MHSSDPNPTFPSRRKILGAMASVAGVSAAGVSASALLGLDPAHVAAEPGGANGAMGSPAEAEHAAPEQLFAQARLRDYKTRRSSSWDRTGGNADAVPVEPGATATLLDVRGAGVVTHIWFTISSEDRMHLKNLVLRA